MTDPLLPADPAFEDDDRLLQLIVEFVNAEDWEASRRVLRRSPLLLSEQAARLFDRMIQGYLDDGDLRLAHHLAMHRDLLIRCRQIGYDEAFRLISTPPGEGLMEVIVSFIEAEDWEATRQELDAHPELLSHEADAAFQALIQAALEVGDQARLAVLTSHHELLRACQEWGVDEGFRRVVGTLDEKQADELMTLSVLGHNTIAVLLGEPEMRDDWMEQLRALQRSAREEGSTQTARLAAAALRLLKGEPPAAVRPRLEGAHAAVWGQILAALEAGQPPAGQPPPAAP